MQQYEFRSDNLLLFALDFFGSAVPFSINDRRLVCISFEKEDTQVIFSIGLSFSYFPNELEPYISDYAIL